VPRKRPITPRFVGQSQPEHARDVVLYPELVGLVLRHFRARAKLLQEQLAQQLNWPQPKVSRIERGDSHLSVDQLAALVEVLNRYLPQHGEDEIHYWDVLARADKLARDLADMNYAVTWCSGKEWPGPEPLLRGEQLRSAIGLAQIPFST